MDAGIAYAKEYGLKPGISLTREQMASLTSDMVWLETTTVTVNGKTYEVLYPKVYLKPGNMTLTAEGSLISADALVAETEETLENNASILGNTVVLKGNDVVNLGEILGKDISLRAERDVIQQGLITGEDRATLTAGRDISMGNTILHGKNQDILNTTAGIAVKGKEGVLLMESERDIHLTGATLLELSEQIINETGATINESGQWISNTGEYIGDQIWALIVWAKSGRQLKRLPKKIIDNKGGEEWIRELKKETGKSKSDLYWNPQTGDVYSVPKRGGGEPEWVGNVKY